MNLVNVADLTNPKTGKTYRQENNEKQHNVPVGSLVEVQFDEWFGDGACWKAHAWLWVVAHNRDCDGTPLYTLSRWNDSEFALQVKQVHSGFSEESLSVIEVTEKIKQGYDVLEWQTGDDGKL